MATATATHPRAPARGKLASILLLGALVALSLGIYGKVHEPTDRSLLTLFFTDTITLKVWLATVVVTLAGIQGLTGLRVSGKLGKGRGPRWIPRVHRASGTLAFLLAIPVAYHCLWALGFHADEGARRLVHGVAGCFFFGALTSKVLAVRSRRLPRWAVPVLGGALFAAIVVIWTTSSLWFFSTYGLKV